MMFSDFKIAMGSLSLAIMLLAYGILLWRTVFGDKRPHPMTWFGFGLCTGTGYIVQVFRGAGAGSWVMGWTAFFCIIVAVAGWTKGGWKFDNFDKWSFGLGFATFGLWFACYLLDLDPTAAAVLATGSDLFLYGPSIKKGWRLPKEDSAISYFLNSMKFVPALLALDSYSMATSLYPAALIVANWGMCTLIWTREEWLSGGLELLYKVLFIERGVDQTKHPDRYRRHNMMTATAAKMSVIGASVSAVPAYILLMMGHSSGETWQWSIIAATFGACGGFLMVAALSDKMGYEGGGISYAR